ncbi:MAG: HYR domain-containing protein [Saprospiraceae bacterium]
MQYFLLDSGSGSCCYELKTLVTQPNCFTQLDITLSSGDFTNTQFGPGWNISTNGNTVSLTPSAGGFIPVGQDMPVIICAPNGNDPYTVDIDFVYNGGTCHQTRNFSCFPPIDSCCTDSIAFITVAMGVGTNEVYGDCTISVESVGLGDCMQISWDWGDGTQEGPYTGNTPLTHNYSGNGPHTVCYTIEEVDINGNPCWELEQCLPYSVHCNDTCTCLGFSNLSFSYGPGPVYDWEIPVDCENNPAQLLPCIPSDGYYNFTGDFGCSNDCISSIQYAIYQNSNPLSAGLVNYTGGPSYFSVPSVKFPPGTYELILTGLCGINDTCFCTITFTIPDCPGPCHVNLSSTQNADCTVTISASTTGPQPISYKWCDGRTDSTFTVYQTPCTTQTYCVTITCADGSTSTAVLPVTTVDAIPPIALCKPAAMVSLDTNCTYKVTVAFVDNGSSDNCGIQFMSVSPSSLIGCVDTSVVLTVTDSCGNTSSCSMNIQTKESTPPEIHCPQDTTIYGFITPNGQCIAPYFAPSISATDNCDNNVLVTNNAGTLLSEGTNTITYTATDDCENQSNCSYVVTVVCDTCACGSFSDLFARPSVGAPSIQLSCGGMYDFGCPPPGFSIPITGKFECQGNNCPITTNIIYTLVGPNQQSSTGFVQASPYFYLPIPPANYAQSGVYILTLQGSCGGQDCDSCVISFAVDCPDPCPCDKPKFHAEVDKGFAVSHHINACKACFSPIGLNDCDEVEWKVDGGPVVGTSAGKQSFCHTFPGGASSYVIEMIVTRKTSTGEICDVYGHSQTVAITCTNWQDCNNSVFPNPKFTEGSQSGKMSGDGKTDGWYAPCGDPVVWEGIPPGTNNGWTIQLTGNLDSADVLSTIDPVCLEKMAGSGSLRVNIWWWFDEMLKWCPPTADDKLIIQLYREMYLK